VGTASVAIAIGFPVPRHTSHLLTPVPPLNHSNLHAHTRETTRLPRKDWLERVHHAPTCDTNSPSLRHNTARRSYYREDDWDVYAVKHHIRTDVAGFHYWSLKITVILQQ
jgi:hypothetical protein